jgi:hypothetical protein
LIFFKKAMMAIAILSALSILLWTSRDATYVASFGRHALSDTEKFSPAHIPFENFHVWDIGAADVDQDGFLDIYSVNHDFAQSFISKRNRHWEIRRIGDLGLSQTPGIAEIAASANLMAPPKSGLWIRPSAKPIGLRVSQIGNPMEPISGEISLFCRICTYSNAGGVEVSLKVSDVGSGWRKTIFRFSFYSAGDFLIKHDPGSVPVTVTLDGNVDLAKVLIGQGMHLPDSRVFQVNLRDRHSMAWGDIDQDGDKDLFVLRGGLKGFQSTYPDDFVHELFLFHQGEYFPSGRIDLQSLGNCRGRSANWHDINSDGIIDLFVTCTQAEGNRLYIQGQRSGVSEFPEFKLSNSNSIDNVGGLFRWFDVDRDGDIDLLQAGNGLWLHRNQGCGSFAAEKISNISSVVGIALGQLNGGKYTDVFVSSEKKSLLLLNNDGNLEPVLAENFGFPRQVWAAAFLDYDNDGKQEVLTLPGGIHRVDRAGHAMATGELAINQPNSLLLWEARITPADFDNDGKVDLVVAWLERLPRLFREIFDPEPLHDWNVNVYERVGNVANWLGVDVSGPVGNKDAFGAFIEVDNGTLQALPIGAFETSKYSQGNFRLHFGVGDSSEVSVRVHWPNEGQSEWRGVVPNQILRIGYDEWPVIESKFKEPHDECDNRSRTSLLN